MSSLMLRAAAVACISVLPLGGCKQQTAAPASVAVEQSALDVTEAAPPEVATGGDDRPSGDGISIAGIHLDLGFEHEIVYDRLDEGGEIRQRKIFVEALELSAAEVEAQVTQALETQGYALVDRKTALGGHRLDFSKPGTGRIVALVRPRLKGGEAPAAGIVQFTASERSGDESSEQAAIGQKGD